MSSLVFFPARVHHARLGAPSEPIESCIVPELHLSDETETSSETVSSLHSPESLNQSRQSSILSQPLKEPEDTLTPPPAQKKANPPQIKPYTRISVSDLINPTSQEPLPRSSSQSKRRLSKAPTLEQSVRHGLQMVQHQRKIESSSKTKPDSLASCLVDLSVMTIELIWGPGLCSSSESPHKAIKHYVTELFRRSQASQAVVQFALIYCLRVRNSVTLTRKVLAPCPGPTMRLNAALCGRRMFMASLICASKYLLDSNFSNKTWAKIVGMSSIETSLAEALFLRLVDYNLYVKDPDFHPIARTIIDQTLVTGHVSRTFQCLVDFYFKAGSK